MTRRHARRGAIAPTAADWVSFLGFAAAVWLLGWAAGYLPAPPHLPALSTDLPRG